MTTQQMFYPNLKFPKVLNRPFFYTNFVSTLDGKVQVKLSGYWPIGSKTDYQVVLELRAHADALIHGGNLAREFGRITLKNLNKTSFKNRRQKLGKNPILPYLILSNNPRSLGKYLVANVIQPKNGIMDAVERLKELGYKNVLVEGGPTLLGSFLKENLIDEIFLTIVPKIFGSASVTLTLIEGILFPPDKIKRLNLISVKQIGNELFLRYRTKRF